jgi:aspartate carbamoyltransferase regulatory subunit
MLTKTLSVTAIENGTVIDRIESGMALKILDLLKLPKERQKITIAMNLQSSILGLKDIIKVEDWYLNENDANQIAIISPQARVNIIKEYQVVSKADLQVPKEIKNIIVCPNKNCITHSERMPTSFLVEQLSKGPLYYCKYCERRFLKEDIKLK